MIVPPIPSNEQARIRALEATCVLDTPAEERFDRLTRLAKRMFGVPIALVSLVDENRQWFKSCDGLDVRETGRDISFCGHAILGDDVFMIPDAALDERFADNPLVVGGPNIRFYTGCPLRASDGSKLGTLCVIDREPRTLDAEDLEVFRDLAKMAEQELAAVQLATTDQLTQLSNRRGFEALAKHAIAVCRRLGREASLMYFDLDRFKEINDRFGHPEGDRALKSFAQVLKETFRDSDVVGRLGGDEFSVFATGASASDLQSVLERLKSALAAANAQAARGYDILYSVGFVQLDAKRHFSLADLISEADVTMYDRKRAKRPALSRAVGA